MTKDFFPFRQNKCFWINIIAMLVVVFGLLFGALKGLDIYTRHGEAVVVPDVKGMKVAEAGKVLEGKKLRYLVSDSTYIKALPAGCILDCHPEVGQKVKESRIVYLTINTLNIPLCDVPDVADNSSAREAEARLLAAGFRLTSNDSIPGEKDWVYNIRHGNDTLATGARVPVGSILTLIIGNGESVSQPTDSLAADSLGLLPDTSGGGMPEEESWF